MPIDKETYLQASQEHVELARRLYEQHDYGPAHYIAGLAVECLLRAYRKRVDSRFDSRHVLENLARQARFYDVIPLRRQEGTAAALTEVVLRWRNEHRFRSRDAMLKWLKSLRLDRGIRGDVLKESARKITNAALEIVAEGVLRWPRS